VKYGSKKGGMGQKRVERNDGDNSSKSNNNSNNINNGNRKQRKRIAPEDRSIPFNCSMPYSDFIKLEDERTKIGVDRSEVLRRALQFYYHYKQPRASEEEAAD